MINAQDHMLHAASFKISSISKEKRAPQSNYLMNHQEIKYEFIRNSIYLFWMKGLVITKEMILPCKYRRISNVFAVECSSMLWNFILKQFRFLIELVFTAHIYTTTATIYKLSHLNKTTFTKMV